MIHCLVVLFFIWYGLYMSKSMGASLSNIF